MNSTNLKTELASFAKFDKKTIIDDRGLKLVDGIVISVPSFRNGFWTAKQRQNNSLHEVAYRACFKAELPRFFIERLTQPGEVVHDCFAGRGTTLLEAALLGRIPVGNDASPLSAMLIGPRLNPSTAEQVKQRLAEIDFNLATEIPESLFVFYHSRTLQQICSLREYLRRRQAEGTFDSVDHWVRMVAINRLTGHSPGFFSVYTLPPNQAVSIERQKKINQQREQVPTFRDVPTLILKKTKDLLKNCDAALLQVLRQAGSKARFFTGSASLTLGIPDNSVKLVVTSPPFLDVVDYQGDNWLRCWFAGIDPQSVQLTICRKLEHWQLEMTSVFREVKRVLRPDGYLAFEVGEVRGGKIELDQAAIPCGVAVGLEPVLVLINEQRFTKTSNCWGIENNAKGTNTNRIVVFRKPV